MICGVDISRDWLEAELRSKQAHSCFANDAQGIALLAEFCRQHQVQLVAMEATGGYERQAFALLSAEAIAVAIVNPRQVRAFARAMGYLEKTDRIDPGVIAHYAEVKQCVGLKPASLEQQRLRALVTRLRQLTELRASQRNQRLLVEDGWTQNNIAELLKFLNQQIRQLEVAIVELIAADPLWRQLDQSFRTIKGVADRTVARLMAEMPEMGLLSNKKIGKLAGLAPLAADSGQTRGKRTIQGGRRCVREILYVVASVVARHEPDFVAFRQRLLATGKAKKVVRIALAHKLLTRLNAKARLVRQQFPIPA
jgi:transposase